MTATDPLRPVSRRRLLVRLRAEGYHVGEVADGVLGGAWDGNTFTIALVGDHQDVLQVRGTWHRPVDLEAHPGLPQVVNDWNRDRIWPKVFTRPAPDGPRLCTEVCVDVSKGATDAQLGEALACGLGTGLQFFTAMAGLLDREP